MLGAVAVVSLLGCGGTVVGTVDGNSLKVMEGALVLFNDPVSATVFLSDQVGFCETLKKNEFAANSNLLSLSLLRIADDGRPTRSLDPGSYTVTPPMFDLPSSPGRYSQLRFFASDGQCRGLLVPDRSRTESGSIELSSFDTTRATGTFDATFGSGDRLTGTFDVPACSFVIPDEPASCKK
jgi:hypothetical protein